MEIWKDVVGYEGYYEVSSCGAVRSKQRLISRLDGVTQCRSARVKKQWAGKDGYLVVKLSKDGIDKSRYVHDLVAEAFIGEIMDGFDVNHKDFDRTNNDIGNLEIIPHADNVRHSINAGRHNCCRDLTGANNPNYGNRTLSDKYSADKELSRAKQSRQGDMNGRAISVVMITADGNERVFITLSDCAAAMIELGFVGARNAAYISTQISKAAKRGTTYSGCHFKLI